MEAEIACSGGMAREVGTLEVSQAAIAASLNQKLLRNGLEMRNELRICTSGTVAGHVTSRAISQLSAVLSGSVLLLP